MDTANPLDASIVRLLAGDIAGARSLLAVHERSVPDGQPVPRIYQNAVFQPALRNQGTPYVTVADEARVETSYWSVIHGDSLYAAEVHGRNVANSPWVRGLAAPDMAAFMMFLPEPTFRVDDPCVHVGGDENYCHWVTRSLLKLSLLGDEFRGVPWLVNGDLRRHQLEWMELLGVDAERHVRAPANAVGACRRLVVPSCLRNHPRMIDGIAWLREQVADQMADAATELLYVSRQDATRRRVSNEEEIIAALVPLGFRVITPGNMTVAEQIRAFSAARVIVAPHGAALANLVFAPAGTLVVELVSEALLHMNDFRVLAGQMGLPIRTLVSRHYVRQAMPQPERVTPPPGSKSIQFTYRDNDVYTDFAVDVPTMLEALHR
jgi:hypothetical protein